MYMCTISNVIGIYKKKKYVYHTRNTEVAIDVKEQMWLPNV